MLVDFKALIQEMSFNSVCVKCYAPCKLITSFTSSQWKQYQMEDRENCIKSNYIPFEHNHNSQFNYNFITQYPSDIHISAWRLRSVARYSENRRRNFLRISFIWRRWWAFWTRVYAWRLCSAFVIVDFGRSEEMLMNIVSKYYAKLNMLRALRITNSRIARLLKRIVTYHMPRLLVFLLIWAICV